MDRPPSHHPDCTCEIDQLDERTVSASNHIIQEAAHVSAGHQLCSHNMLVAAYFLVEYMREVCKTEVGSDIDTKARETARNFYLFSASEWDSSYRRSLN